MASRPIYKSTVVLDAAVQHAAAGFDYGRRDNDGKYEHAFDGVRIFEGWAKPEVPLDFGIGLLLGPSGSGKTLLLRQFGTEETPTWEPTKAVVSQFGHSDVALEKLEAVGLNSVPSWCSPFHVLSNGEQFRANLARKLKDGAVIDEFTSVVDRNVAKSASVALRRYVDRRVLKGIVLASCHYDILEWLRPDWWFDTVDGVLHSGRLLRRPEIKVRIYPCKRTLWTLFRNFHYYNTGALPSSCRPFVATAEFGANGIEEVVGFVASRPLPSGTMKKAWIACRTVVLPDFQGLGIGPRISDAVAKIHVDEGKRYFSKTTSHRLGGWRDRPASDWKPTSKYDPKKGPMGRFNRRKRGNQNITAFGGTRIGGFFSHEYVRSS
jgi:hypothetical protein